MAALPNSRSLVRNPDRRFFLWSLASLGLAPKTRKSEKQSEPVYRFMTRECEVRMSVQYFSSSQAISFHFRDRLTNRAFCLSANGEEDRTCLERFAGAIAIARYDFSSGIDSPTPLRLRERVLTIDHDSRMSPRHPFERALAIESQVASDIQAFGYNRDDRGQATSSLKSPTVWCLLRQDLYLNDRAAAFLIIHWKHTVDSISLLDVIPGDGTQRISE
jgi:hypothetical protein